jgi:hypothetical protein
VIPLSSESSFKKYLPFFSRKLFAEAEEEQKKVHRGISLKEILPLPPFVLFEFLQYCL